MPKKAKIRVRFAPSPTGFLHIGSLRTIMLNYLFAKKEKGDFILRIEDTDQERFIEGAIESLNKTLDILGIKFDEGPYSQSQRLGIYKTHIEQLLEQGRAYYCFCTEERLEQMRKKQIADKQAPMYDKHCRNLDKKTITENLKDKIPYTIRLKVPEGESIKFNDLLHGEIEFRSDLVDDQVLIKSDGFPTYHFASTIDDHLMEISHVIRGEEWLSSTPKHILLYEYFGWKPPIFIHPSLMLSKDGGKLSKRKGDVSVESFLEKGYLPEALLNYIGLLILSVPDKANEVLNIKDMTQMFDWNRVHKNPAIFNTEKLDWINAQHIRKMPIKTLTKLCLNYFPKENNLQQKDLEKIIALEQERINKLSDIAGESTEFFFREPKYAPSILAWKNASKQETQESLQKTYDILCDIKEADFTAEKLKQVLLAIPDRGKLLWPLRVALSGKEKSPGPFEIAEIIGKPQTLKRILKAIDLIK